MCMFELCRTLAPPQMLWSESKDKYIDKTMYRDTVPAEKKKKGFMSSDFPRRDEFSNTIRTAQLREVLKVRCRIQGFVVFVHVPFLGLVSLRGWCVGAVLMCCCRCWRCAEKFGVAQAGAISGRGTTDSAQHRQQNP